jgi:hypothetical protein
MLPAILMPLISKGLSLVGNAVLTKGTEWVEEKTGLDLNKSELTPQDTITLRQFEMEHEEELMKMKLEEDKLAKAIDEMYLVDTQSARTMQSDALKQDDKLAKNFIYYYAMFWSAAAVIYIGAITFAPIPQASIRFADTILGFLLGTIVAQIISFFYGSSKSSKDKTGMVSELSSKLGLKK